MNSSSRYFGIVLEEIRDQNWAVLEAVADVRTKVDGLSTREEFQVVVDDVQTSKALLTETNCDIAGLKLLTHSH